MNLQQYSPVFSVELIMKENKVAQKTWQQQNFMNHRKTEQI